MATLNFDGTNDRININPLSTSLNNIPNGTATIALLLRVVNYVNAGMPYGLRGGNLSGDYYHGINLASDQVIHDDDGTGLVSWTVPPMPFGAGGNNFWIFVWDWSGAAATERVHFSSVISAAESWTHDNSDNSGASARAGPGTGTGYFHIGNYDGDPFEGDIALIAVWAGTRFSDSDAEALWVNKKTSDWYNHSAGTPDTLIELTTTTPVDIGADPVSTITLSGPTLTGADPTGWDFDGQGAETFPTTGLLDDFNRADETPLSQSGAWDGPVRAGTRTRLRLVGNAVARATSGSTSEDYRVGMSFTESEAYFTVSVLPNTTDFALVLARIQSVESTNADFYAMEISRIGAGNYSIDAYRVIDAAFTSLAVVATGVDLQVGDKFGMEVTGTGATVTLRCFMDTGSGWAQVGSDVLDTDGARITAAGPIGLSIGGITGTLWRIDDFGGGEVARFPSGSLPWFKTT